MKRFFRRAALFSLPLVAAWGGCEAGLLRAGPTIYSVRREVLARRAGEIRVLVLGNSQSMVGVRPEFISRAAFNLAHNSQDLYYDRGLVQRYAGELPRLELVVLSISYLTLESKLSESPEQWRRCFYYRYFDVPHEDGPAGAGHLSDVSLVALHGREESAKLAFRFFRPRREKVDEGGWPVAKSEPGPKAFSADVARQRVERHHAAMKAGNLETNLSHLEALVEGLTARKVRVALFSPPLTGEYRAHLRPDALGRMQSALRQVCERRGLRYVDYSADSRFTTADFKDVDHLNPRGAEKLTRILNDEVVEAVFR